MGERAEQEKRHTVGDEESGARDNKEIEKRRMS